MWKYWCLEFILFSFSLAIKTIKCFFSLATLSLTLILTLNCTHQVWNAPYWNYLLTYVLYSFIHIFLCLFVFYFFSNLIFIILFEIELTQNLVFATDPATILVNWAKLLYIWFLAMFFSVVYSLGYPIFRTYSFYQWLILTV